MSDNLVIHSRRRDIESPLELFKAYFPNNTNPERSVKDITRRILSAYTDVEHIPLENALRNAGKTKQEINLKVIMVIQNEHDFIMELVQSDLEDTIKKPLNEFRDKELLKQDCVNYVNND